MTAAAAPVAGIPRLNEITGLSTDYLNHFSEAIMVLEMISAAPECVEDFLAWEPRSYSEHFAASRFTDRHAAITAYRAADPLVRESLDTLADIMNTMLMATREAIAADPTAPKALALAKRAVTGLKPMVSRAAAVINGNEPLVCSARTAPQNAVDELFNR